ncbi:ABC transporter ATP-binding protein [Clostridium estertheticum]|uniref:ABC transporter ATP-binding protein n=1 Tax=Clostridium estertheticum TaxID=238834 RepID=UPI001CF58CEB|nr:ABC transporter ATP-binding protein [Clostridium estertheticum]MCB2356370.1 ABC transporter ATP-binding protein/permease [Clostridium estertheticum]WAG42673.1 ABC transporter ATP-binding protein/permease [Clostridium estertheticum]
MINKNSTQILELKRFFAQVKGRQFIYWTSLLAAVILNSITQVLIANINKGVLNAVTHSNMQQLKNTAVLALVYIIIWIICPLPRYIHITIVRYIMYDLKSKLFRHMEKLNLSYFEKHHSGDSIERLGNNVDALKTAYFTQVFVVVNTFIMGMTSMITMFIFEWKIAFILIILGLISISISLKYTGKIRKITDKINKESSTLTQRLSDILAGFSILKLFSGAYIAVNRYKFQNNKINDLRMKSIGKQSEMDSINFAFTFLSNIGVIVAGVLMAAAGWTDLGTVAGIVTLQGSVNWMFLNLGTSYARLQESLSNASRIFEVFDAQPEEETYKTNQSYDKSSMISLENVYFNYEGRENIINNINLSVKKGQHVAFVGPSGGGKSTVIKLILGFYPIATGSITINGKSMSEYNIHEIRDMIAYVPQDAYLFDGTIMENIRFGRLIATDKEVIEAAKAAYSHDFIQKLPEGYNTEVISSGNNLSGGQRQRIAIARAFLKDAPILLLDEATSALDTESENQIQISLEALMKNRTTIAIAHRLTTIENSDIIFVIENGSIVEQGTSKDLVDKAGLYMRLKNI